MEKRTQFEMRKVTRITDIPTDRIVEYTAEINEHKISMLIN